MPGRVRPRRRVLTLLVAAVVLCGVLEGGARVGVFGGWGSTQTPASMTATASVYTATLAGDGTSVSFTGIQPGDYATRYLRVANTGGAAFTAGYLYLNEDIDRTRIARLNADGTMDTFGSTLAGANGAVRAVAVQSDGKVVIGGSFTTVNGTARGGIARLNADGSLDTGFANGLAGVTGGTAEVRAVAVQSDGKVVIGGGFTTVHGTARGGIARLNADGSLDTGFANGLAGVTGGGAAVYAVALDTNSKAIIGGSFTTVHGTARGDVARLGTDGSLDTTFANGLAGTDGVVYAMAIQSADAKILVGGTFSSVNGTTQRGLARLNTDGSLDTTLTANVTSYDSTNVTTYGGSVLAIAVQTDTSIVLGGEFTLINGTSVSNGVARVSSTGTLDSTFQANVPAIGRANGLSFCNVRCAYVYTLTLQSDGKILVGGDFYTAGGTQRRNLVRLNTDGTADTSYFAAADNVVYASALQSNGKVVFGGAFASIGGNTGFWLGTRMRVEYCSAGLVWNSPYTSAPTCTTWTAAGSTDGTTASGTLGGTSTCASATGTNCDGVLATTLVGTARKQRLLDAASPLAAASATALRVIYYACDWNSTTPANAGCHANGYDGLGEWPYSISTSLVFDGGIRAATTTG